MSSGDENQGMPHAVTIFGVAAAAVLGFTMQPVVSIADPIALLICGILIATVAFGFAANVHEKLTGRLETFFGFSAVMAALAMVFTVGDAWREQRSVNATCSRLQQVMLYEHRKRTDVPEIFRSLGCKIQG